MAVIVVGGNSRSVGKTSVVAGLIAALPEYRWAAFKITQFGHGQCSRNGEACECATASHTWGISEETERSGKKDTSRFLLAGATPVWWVRTAQGRLAEAMPAIRQRLSKAENAILESNTIVKFLRPNLYLSVLDPATEDFKRSAQELLDRADAVIVHRAGDGREPLWRKAGLAAVEDRPVFFVQPPEYLTSEIVDWVRSRLTERPVASAARDSG